MKAMRDSGQRRDRMIHLAEDRDVQIAEVARHKPGHDLAPAISQRPIATGEARQHHMHVLGPLALADQVLVGRNDLRERDEAAARASRSSAVSEASRVPVS